MFQKAAQPFPAGDPVVAWAFPLKFREPILIFPAVQIGNMTLPVARCNSKAPNNVKQFSNILKAHWQYRLCVRWEKSALRRKF